MIPLRLIVPKIISKSTAAANATMTAENAINPIKAMSAAVAPWLTAMPAMTLTSNRNPRTYRTFCLLSDLTTLLSVFPA